MGKYFKVSKHRSPYSGVEGAKITATYALADQLRLQNYLRILELKSELNNGKGSVSKRDEILNMLLKQLEEEDE